MDDAYYLVSAYREGGVTQIGSGAVRDSLQRAGYMLPTAVRVNSHHGGSYPRHGMMALTKRGQQRAKQILDALPWFKKSVDYHLHLAQQKRPPTHFFNGGSMTRGQRLRLRSAVQRTAAQQGTTP